MSAADLLLEKMDTPEWRAKIAKWAENERKKEAIKQAKIQDILSNPDYMKWLEDFTLKYPDFTNRYWTYSSDLSAEDSKRVEDLVILYNLISSFATKNYIYQEQRDSTVFYRIQNDNIGYEIGIISGLGIEFFCKRVEIEPGVNFIDFNDIRIDKKYDNVDYIENSLNNLSTMVRALYENGVPLEALNSTLGTTLNELKSQKDLVESSGVGRK